MSGGSIGPLLAADEGFNHQIVDTFASVAHTDPAWTEKVCGMAAARDGSLQVGFGFGKYVNRNVVDGYGGVSRGVAQWAVQASRELSHAPDSIGVGPLHYEVIEPLRRIRVRLDATDVQPMPSTSSSKASCPASSRRAKTAVASPATAVPRTRSATTRPAMPAAGSSSRAGAPR